MATSSGQVRRRQRGGGPHEVVHRVARPRHEGGPGVGDAARVVRLQDGRAGGEPRADRLRAAAEAGEEVGLDEAGDDAQVGLDVLALQQHRRPVDLAHGDVRRRSSRRGRRWRSAPTISGPTSSSISATRGLPVGPGGAQERDALVGHPASAPARPAAVGARCGSASGASGRGRRRRPGPRRPPASPSGRPAHGLPQGRRDRRGLVRQARLVHRDDDLGVVGDLDRRPVAAVGQLDAHGSGASGPVPGSDSVAASTASATWSTRGRRAR